MDIFPPDDTSMLILTRLSDEKAKECGLLIKTERVDIPEHVRPESGKRCGFCPAAAAVAFLFPWSTHCRSLSVGKPASENPHCEIQLEAQLVPKSGGYYCFGCYERVLKSMLAVAGPRGAQRRYFSTFQLPLAVVKV